MTYQSHTAVSGGPSFLTASRPVLISFCEASLLLHFCISNLGMPAWGTRWDSSDQWLLSACYVKALWKNNCGSIWVTAFLKNSRQHGLFNSNKYFLSIGKVPGVTVGLIPRQGRQRCLSQALVSVAEITQWRPFQEHSFLVLQKRKRGYYVFLVTKQSQNPRSQFLFECSSSTQQYNIFIYFSATLKLTALKKKKMCPK